jgi:hypothetical protein
MIAGGYVSQEKNNKMGGHFKEQNALLQALCSSKHPPLAQEKLYRVVRLPPNTDTRKLLIGLYDGKEKWG